jgi:hypothetical protein
MLTIGHGYACPAIHAGGLRYHGMAPSISYLIVHGYMRSVAYHQNEVFKAAKILAQTEGLIIAPETAHSLKFVIDEGVAMSRNRREKGDCHELQWPRLAGHRAPTNSFWLANLRITNPRKSRFQQLSQEGRSAQCKLAGNSQFKITLVPIEQLKPHEKGLAALLRAVEDRRSSKMAY